MPKTSLVLILWTLFESQAQVMGYIGGAESRSLGNIGSVGSNMWAIFNNPAALNPNLKSLSIDITRLYGLDLQDFALGYSSYRPNYQWGIGLNHFGDRYLSQSRFFIAWAKKIGNVCLGLRAGLLQFALIDQTSIRKPHIDIGGSIKLNPKMIMGVYIINATATKLPSIDQTQIQSSIRLGLDYKFNMQTNFYTELEKSIELPIRAKVGIKYQIQNYLIMLLGLNSLPLRVYYGLVTYYQRYTLAYSLTVHQVLGLIHRISIAIVLKSRQTK